MPVKSGRARASVKSGVSGNNAYVQSGKKAVPYVGWLDFGGVLTIWAAGPLFYYQTVNLSMSHSAAFVAIALFAYALTAHVLVMLYCCFLRVFIYRKWMRK